MTHPSDPIRLLFALGFRPQQQGHVDRCGLKKPNEQQRDPDEGERTAHPADSAAHEHAQPNPPTAVA